MEKRCSVLVVGGGGREHAVGWKFAQDKRIEKIWFAPGNAGTAQVGVNLPFASTDLDGITGWAVKERPGLVVIGPEAPLCAGLADRLRGAGIRVFGPGASGAQLEGSKSFSVLVFLCVGEKHREVQHAFVFFRPSVRRLPALQCLSLVMSGSLLVYAQSLRVTSRLSAFSPEDGCQHHEPPSFLAR